MRNKIQKYLSGEREGFSLVELIIVIAIMAILIGIVALAVIPYLEKSRVSKDKQTIDTVYSAFKNEIASQQVSGDVSFEISSSGAGTVTGTFDIAKFAEALDCTDAAGLGKLEAKLESNDAKTKPIACDFDYDSKKITVYVGSDADSATIKSSNKE